WSDGGALHAVLERSGESAVWRHGESGWKRATPVRRGEWLRPLWGLGERSYCLRGEEVGGVMLAQGAPLLVVPGSGEAAAPGSDIAGLANPLALAEGIA